MATGLPYGSENISRDIYLASDCLLTCIVAKCVLLDYYCCHCAVLA